MERTQLLSVGIDIGTSTSQLVFSRLTVENKAGYFSVPSVSIIGKEVFYQSPIYRPPLLDQTRIDGEALEKILDQEYKAAGIAPGQVETGAVIITGESARKENAGMILERMSRFAGDFVVSTAGPDLEAVIAGQGSGAWQFSERQGTTVINLDIGGGTTNVVLFDRGRVRAKGSVDIGGRQVRIDKDGFLSCLSPSASRIGQACGLKMEEGERISQKMLEQLCDGMCRILEELVGARKPSALLEAVRTAGSTPFCLPEDCHVKYLCFSGGVADCMGRRQSELFPYGDIGVLLAEAIQRSRLFRDFSIISADQTIRATVIGAGSHTTSISGSTISYAKKLLPLKNMPVLKLSPEEEELCWQGDSKNLRKKAAWFLAQNDTARIALAIRGRYDPGYQEMKSFAKALAMGLDPILEPGIPLLFIIEADMAKALGQLLRRELAGSRPVLAVDEIRAEPNDFVDFGRPVMNGLVVPVVVKTLIFG
mgnify:CR=1 FL=1